MAKEKTVKRIVAHPKLYMRVDGKLQHIPKGTELTLTEGKAKDMGAKVLDPKEAKKLDATAEGGALTKGEGTESEAVKELAAELKAAKAETEKATKALTATAAKLGAAQKEIKALKAAAKK